ncbi:hypothetical protein M9Y10_034338 [Tritrichomonas musculus]|uniref:RING-type domain-containing protein n=1 Tax=Tritrichomonas musculus TaxID=1915356 RepID=A0ABR2KFD0_9EUKA
MLNQNTDEDKHFLFTYFKPPHKNSIEQYEDDFITQFQLIHDEIEEATQNLCKEYEEIADAYEQISKHKCVYCQVNNACVFSTACGHVLFCEDCFTIIREKFKNESTISCPVCMECHGIDRRISNENSFLKVTEFCWPNKISNKIE